MIGFALGVVAGILLTIGGLALLAIWAMRKGIGI